MPRKRRAEKAPRWRFLVELPSAYNPAVRPEGTADFPWGRTWTLVRDDGKRAVVDVEASAAALSAYVEGTLPKTGRLAIQSEGRTAVERHLGERDLPARIVITGAGVRGAR